MGCDWCHSYWAQRKKQSSKPTPVTRLCDCSLQVPLSPLLLEPGAGQTLAELLILPDKEERTSCKVLLLLLLLKWTKHGVTGQAIWQRWPAEKSVRTKRIISGYGRKLPQFREMNCSEPATFSRNIWLVALIILPPYTTEPSLASPLHRMATKKRCFAVCTACACWNPAWEILGTQELKRCPNASGRIRIWKHSALARGRFSAFPPGREGQGLCSIYPR